VQADAIARHTSQRPVDRAHDPLDETQEIGERAVLVGDVPLQGQIRAIELQKEAVADDGLVLDAQRIGQRREIGLLAVVMLVLHRRRDDPGRGGGQERFDKAPLGRLEDGAEIVAFGIDRRRIQIAHRRGRLGRQEIADRGAGGLLLLQPLLEDRVAGDVAALPALPAAAKATHAALDVEKEALALLLAIVADVDPGLDLLGHDLPQRLAAGGIELAGVDRLARGAPCIEPDQRRRPRQAARMRGQDPVDAPPHRCLLRAGHVSAAGHSASSCR
jgi:hypothetical protein